MQVWRDVVVQEALLRDEESKDYLQRKHHRMLGTGFAGAGPRGRTRAHVAAVGVRGGEGVP